MTSTIASLDDLLGRELGRRADGESIFAWKNSDELFWPAFATGRKILSRVEVPLLKPVEVSCPACSGIGLEKDYELAESETPDLCEACGGKGIVTKTSDVAETAMPEYRRDRQMRQRNVWVMTKWLDPEALIWGWIGRHGGEAVPTEHPSHSRLEAIWNEHFPGADFPSNGWRVPTDATLPRSPGGIREPNLADTRYFIACVKEQTRLGFDERLKDMLNSEDAIKAAKTKTIEDEIRDAFPAFLNPKPGSRSTFVSFPWTRKDRV